MTIPLTLRAFARLLAPALAAPLALGAAAQAHAAPESFGSVVPATKVELDDGQPRVVPGADIYATVTADAEGGAVVLVDDDGAPLGIWGTGGVAITTGEGLYMTNKVLASGDLVGLQIEDGEYPADLMTVMTMMEEKEPHAMPVALRDHTPTTEGIWGSSGTFLEGIWGSSGTLLEGIWGSSGTLTAPLDLLDGHETGIDPESLPMGDPWSDWLVIDGLWAAADDPGLVHGIGTLDGTPVAIRIDASPLAEATQAQTGAKGDVLDGQVVLGLAALLGGTATVKVPEDGVELPAVQAALEGSGVDMAGILPVGGTDYYDGIDGECILGDIVVFALDG